MIEARFRGALGGFDLDVAFAAPGRGLTALFGPSGCGKTTILRAVAGLQRFADGRFALGGEVWQDGRAFRPTHKRPIGYVFQEASLFPHLSVRSNLAYGLRRALRGGAAETLGFDEVADLLGIARLLDRSPQHLSGGERQRVAMGRALLSQPRLLLMDEPLAALDRFSKDDILPYLERVRDVFGVPILYVSHDIAEVERLADHIVHLKAGRIVAAGPMRELQADPRLPIARTAEAGVTLAARVVAMAADGIATLAVEGGEILAPGDFGAVGGAHRLRILASDVSLVRARPAGSTVLNYLPARIVAAEPQGVGQVVAALALGGEGARILARVTRRSWDGLGYAVGQEALAQVKAAALVTRGE